MVSTGNGSKIKKKWLRVSMNCSSAMVEPVSDLLARLSQVGTEMSTANKDVMVTSYFALEEKAKDREELSIAVSVIKKMVQDELEQLSVIFKQELEQASYEIIEEQDWSNTWKEFFTTTEIAPGVIIKPSWEQYELKKGEVLLELDPGMAFGTGQHASTKMALGHIQASYQGQAGNTLKKVLDVGTGTGILAMGAALLGAEEVLAIDNDPEAVEAAEENVRKNSLETKVYVSGRDLMDLTGPFDMICANIVHDVLVEMAPTFKKITRPEAVIVLAGILAGDQEKNIIRVYAELGMSLKASTYQEEWVALCLQRNSL